MDVIRLSSRDVGGADPAAPPLVTWGLFILFGGTQGQQVPCFLAKDVVQTVLIVVGSGHVKGHATVEFETESDLWMGEGVRDDNIHDTGVFGLWPSLEGQTRWNVGEQTGDGDRGSTTPSARFDGAFVAVTHVKFGGFHALLPALERQFADHANGGQGLAPEAHRVDGSQVFTLGQF